MEARERWTRQRGRPVHRRVRLHRRARAGHADLPGSPELADPGAWTEALAGARTADCARGASTVGPHRDDLRLEIGGRPLREFGSTGQQRSAAVALKLLELATLREARGTEPALLLDDVFAELDDERRQRLAPRLIGPEDRQVFVTAPRAEELPRELAPGGVEREGWEGRASRRVSRAALARRTLADALTSYSRSGLAKRVQQAG